MDRASDRAAYIVPKGGRAAGAAGGVRGRRRRRPALTVPALAAAPRAGCRHGRRYRWYSFSNMNHSQLLFDKKFIFCL